MSTIDFETTETMWSSTKGEIVQSGNKVGVIGGSQEGIDSTVAHKIGTNKTINHNSKLHTQIAIFKYFKTYFQIATFKYFQDIYSQISLS